MLPEDGIKFSPIGSLLESIISIGLERFATDIHICQRDACLLRIGGQLVPLITEHDEIFKVQDEDFGQLFKELKLTKGNPASHMVRRDEYQMRVLYANYEGSSNRESIILRLQPTVPPELNTLISKPKTLDFLRRAHGLVMIVGSIGSGKSTFAASLVQAWASQRRHIVTMEDPIEYQLRPDSGFGQITQFPCGIIASSKSGLSFDEAIGKALRSDADGFFIGECRDSISFKNALELSTAHEPCITTLHAGGITDAIIRAFTLGSQHLTQEITKLTLAQALHSVIHVSLAFNETGKPVPIVIVLPFKTQESRQVISELNPKNLRDQITNLFKADESEEGISYQEAKKYAVEKGVKESEISNLLEPYLAGPSYLE